MDSRNPGADDMGRDRAGVAWRRRLASTLVTAGLVCGGVAFAQAGANGGAAVPPAQVVLVGDAIPEPLLAAPGDAARGRAIITDRQVGLCLLCHSGPFPDQRFQGDIAPSLAGAGSRWSAGQLRLRIADPGRLNPSTIMPSYYRLDGLQRVAPSWQGKTVLSAQQIEDVIAYLRTMRN
ncbi:sulfur oxidation c-type cytochrome SoxX [Lacisediminimonas sp.]|uniref:sulfur oxidation c-type cytochrome SoxX n=1 Tax=Lacisediminimonas sp. TaxID=3060582 RepID=UPI00271684AC|nr:sulfur oxidation c-type cytochrome SoxX [Lacisediminimonas sp.]MDO8298209.1 sulfur oxidation c-type cytochrome SoxX [Lacisediminimonas sp.]